ncbi:MAG: cation:proton antiporter [Alphaproteobacteria bacterium]|jgi:glutathione-regulated potassium-efflux system ancillary protein KefC
MSTSILIFLGILFLLIFLFKLARIGTLLAFLIAGIIAGPYVLNLWQISESWNFLGEIGVMFLWFVIGLELNIKRLWSLRKNIFGFGAAQVMMVAIILFPILFGLTSWSIMGAIMVSLMLAMSSTPNDTQILADRNELQTNTGRQIFSILLFQDLLSIPLLAMLPIFAGHGFNFGAQIIDVLVMSAGLVLGVVIVGKLLLNPLMRLVVRSKSKEAFLLVILLNIVLWAVIFNYLKLPPAIGAFLAGMLFSETVYRHQVQADIQPYHMLFLSFFFIALGLGLDVPVLLKNWWVVALGVIGLVVIKFVAIYIVARVRHVSSRESFFIALVLAQGGEFGLLILQTMKTNGIQAIPSGDAEILTAIIILSIMVSPILIRIYDIINRNGKFFKGKKFEKSNILTKKVAVIICGFGRVGQTIAQMLESQKIPYAAIESNIDAVIAGQKAGYKVFFGDTTNSAVLKEIGLAPRRTKALVVALNNAAVAKRTIRAARKVMPTVKVFARVRNIQESEDLRSEGKLITLPETIESSFVLGREILERLGVKEKNIENLLDSLRRDNYQALCGNGNCNGH